MTDLDIDKVLGYSTLFKYIEDGELIIQFMVKIWKKNGHLGHVNYHQQTCIKSHEMDSLLDPVHNSGGHITT